MSFLKSRISRCSKCGVVVDIIPCEKSYRCYKCIACVCCECVFPYELIPNHNPVVFCGRQCCDVWKQNRKAEQLAEATAEDIGSEDSTRSSESSSDESMREFVVPDEFSDAEEEKTILSDAWDSEEQNEWAQQYLT